MEFGQKLLSSDCGFELSALPLVVDCCMIHNKYLVDFNMVEDVV